MLLPNYIISLEGWQNENATILRPNVLQWIQGKVISEDKCEWSDIKLGPMELCFWATHNNQGTCSGDSGGPLVCLQGNRTIITGIVNYGYALNGTGYCGKTDVGDVFTNVSHFVLWIQGFMETTEEVIYQSCVVLIY